MIQQPAKHDIRLSDVMEEFGRDPLVGNAIVSFNEPVNLEAAADSDRRFSKQFPGAV